MGALDLTGLKQVVDQWIVDDLRVTRDNGAADDQLDEETGQLVETPEIVVWEGKGMVQPIGAPALLQDPDVQRIVEETNATYRALLLLETPVELQVEQQLRVVQPHGIITDPQITSRRFQVAHPGSVSSWPVLRIIYLTEV